MRKTANKSLQLLPITETVRSIWVLRGHNLCIEFVSSFGTGHNVATVAMLPKWQCFQSGNVAKVAMFPKWQCYHSGNVSQVAMLPQWQCCRQSDNWQILQIIPSGQLSHYLCPFRSVKQDYW